MCCARCGSTIDSLDDAVDHGLQVGGGRIGDDLRVIRLGDVDHANVVPVENIPGGDGGVDPQIQIPVVGVGVAGGHVEDTR